MTHSLTSGSLDRASMSLFCVGLLSILPVFPAEGGQVLGLNGAYMCSRAARYL